MIAQNVLLNEQEMTKWLNELQKEHQKVLFWEAQAKGEERKKFAGLRQEIERQQQRIARPQQIDYQSTAIKLVPPQTVIKNVIMAF